jgi:hypothetical protein
MPLALTGQVRVSDGYLPEVNGQTIRLLDIGARSWRRSASTGLRSVRDCGKACVGRRERQIAVQSCRMLSVSMISQMSQNAAT